MLVSFLLNSNGVFSFYNVFKFSIVCVFVLPEGHNKVFLPVNVGLRVLFFFFNLKIKTGRAGSEEKKILLK